MENEKRKALGKGLEDLFKGDNLDFREIEGKLTEDVSENDIKHLRISDLRPNPYQPRKHFKEEALKELASSIEEYGVLEPIIVKKSSVKGYEIIAGERRVRASKIAGKKTVPSIVRDLTDTEMMEIALLENLQREDLNPIEEAEAYNSLMKHLELTQEELASKLSKSRSYITNTLGLLKLSEANKDLVAKGVLSAGHGRVLSKLKDEKEASKLADRAIKEHLSVRDLEKISKNEGLSKRFKVKKTSPKTFVYREYSNQLEDVLGTKVKVTDSKIEVYYNNKNDLERIIGIING